MSTNGKEIYNPTVYYYLVKNTGNVPITLSDYVEPITISVKKPFRILTVEQEGSNPGRIKTVWKKIDDSNFQLKPLLLNPNDQFGVKVFIFEKPGQGAQKISKSETKEEPAASNGSTNQDNEKNRQQQKNPYPEWTARIVNISDLKLEPTHGQTKRQAEAKTLGIFYTSFYHAGWGLYLFALIVFILFIFGLFLGVQVGMLQQNTLRLHYIVLSALMGLSVVAGDNIASRVSGINAQPLISNISLFLYLLLIGVLTWRTLAKFYQKKSSINNP